MCIRVLARMGFVVACLATWPALADSTGDGRRPNDPTVDSDTAPGTPDLTSKREEIADELRLAQRVLESASPPEGMAVEPAPEKLTREVELLKQLDVIVAQQQTANASTQERQTRQSDLTDQLKAVRAVGPAEERPYSFLLLGPIDR